jgi:hypothetical protein
MSLPGIRDTATLVAAAEKRGSRISLVWAKELRDGAAADGILYKPKS